MLKRFVLALVAVSSIFFTFSAPAFAANDIIMFTDTGKCYDAPPDGTSDAPSEITCPTDNSAFHTTTSNIIKDGDNCTVFTDFIRVKVPCSAINPQPAPTTPPATVEDKPPNTLPPCNYVKNGIRTCAVRSLGNGLEFYALTVAVAGIFISAAMWAIGSKAQNQGQELTGKKGFLVCLAAAFVIGAYPALTTFYNQQAKIADNTGVTTATLPSAGPPP